METRRKTLPDGSRTLYIEPFRNSTTTAQVEKFFTDAIKKEFYNKGDIPLVSKGSAAVTMHGVVESISIVGTAFKQNVNAASLEAKEYLLTIKLLVSLKDRSGKTIWSKTFSDQEIFNVFENIMKSESERLIASSRISKNMMRKVYDSIFASFER
jgi:hypothetical protein